MDIGKIAHKWSCAISQEYHKTGETPMREFIEKCISHAIQDSTSAVDTVPRSELLFAQSQAKAGEGYKQLYELAQARIKELESLVAAVADRLKIGSESRGAANILTNIENTVRRAGCLDAIEREYFTHTYIIDDEEEEGHGEEDTECLLNWGHNPEQYVDQFYLVLFELKASELRKAIGGEA